MRLEHMVEAGGVTLLLGMRLVPVVPFSFFSIAAGAARADLLTFLWTTAVGYLPLTAIFVYLGSKLETLSPTDPHPLDRGRRADRAAGADPRTSSERWSATPARRRASVRGRHLSDGRLDLVDRRRTPRASI